MNLQISPLALHIENTPFPYMDRVQIAPLSNLHTIRWVTKRLQQDDRSKRGKNPSICVARPIYQPTRTRRSRMILKITKNFSILDDPFINRRRQFIRDHAKFLVKRFPAFFVDPDSLGLH